MTRKEKKEERRKERDAQRKDKYKGQTKYKGRPCKQGHTERYVRGGCCVECILERDRDRKVEHLKGRRRKAAERVKTTRKQRGKGAFKYKGEACREGHTERYTKGGDCVACRVAAAVGHNKNRDKKKQHACDRIRAVKLFTGTRKQERGQTFELESSRRKLLKRIKEMAKKAKIDLTTDAGQTTGLNMAWDNYAVDSDDKAARVRSGLVGRGISIRNLRLREEQFAENKKNRKKSKK